MDSIQSTFLIFNCFEALLQFHEALLLFLGLQMTKTAKFFVQIVNIGLGLLRFRVYFGADTVALFRRQFSNLLNFIENFLELDLL